MAHTPQLYLYESIRDSNIKSLDSVKEIYFDRIASVFADIENEAEEYEQDLWKEHMANLNPEDVGDIEIYQDNIAESMHIAGVKRYELLSIMRYRTLALWISLLSQVWEQQNITFLRDELAHEGLSIATEKGKKITGWGIKEITEVYKGFGVELSKLSIWEKIDEMRHLVNVLKHAEGNSAETLRKIRPDFFDSGGWGDSLELYHTSLNEEVLNIENQDFIIYHEALIQFWNELPERMYFVS